MVVSLFQRYLFLTLIQRVLCTFMTALTIAGSLLLRKTNASTGLDSSIASFRGITLKFVSSGGDGDKHAGWVLNYYT
uniref:Secreted protein n=1 Tax=Panagrellus redivivus TaxID=6233 RepID=A0A7E4ZY38_PANRE